MAFRLGDYVTYGELFTTAHYGVYGFLALRTHAEEQGGDHTFVRLELTGDPGPDLQNRHICFEPEDGAAVRYFQKSEHGALRLHQYGATGTMTAQGWVRTLPCAIDEYVARSRLGEPPPAVWKNHLYLEWFGPNGRMIIDLAGVFVEECTRERNEYDGADEGEWVALPNREPRPRDGVGPRASNGRIDITEIGMSGEIAPRFAKDYSAKSAVAGPAPEVRSEPIERAIGTECDDGEEQFLDEPELDEACLKQKEETPLMRLLGGVQRLPRPDTLDSAGAEFQLKRLLGRMARLGVALNVCEHCTPHDAYRMLLDDILPGTTAVDGLIGTGWVQHLMTHDYCEHCERDAEEQFQSAIWN